MHGWRSEEGVDARLHGWRSEAERVHRAMDAMDPTHGKIDLFLSTPTQIPPESGGICGRLT